MTKPKNQGGHLRRGSGTTKADVTHAASMQFLETTRLTLAHKIERLKALRLEAERLAPPPEPAPKRRAVKKAV